MDQTVNPASDHLLATNKSKAMLKEVALMDAFMD
jgi:hypothetical protein